jgi:cholesterol transport system auxiliary component
MKALGLLLLAALLGGCLRLPGPGQAVTYHVLTDPGPVVKSPRTHAATLLVREMDAPALYQVPNPVYSREAGTRMHYQFARWSEPPAKRLTWLLRQRLEAAAVFEVVSPLGGGVRGDYQLNTRLVDFYHDTASPPGIVLLVLEAEVLRRTDARLLERRIFVAQQAVSSHDAAGATEAMGRAANRVIDELTLWLAQVVAEQGR